MSIAVSRMCKSVKEDEFKMFDEKEMDEFEMTNTILDIFEDELLSLETVNEDKEEYTTEENQELDICENNCKKWNSATCKHVNTTSVNDIIICLECGEEIDTNKTKQWAVHKYGKPSMGKVVPRRNDNRTIRKELEGKGISQKIIDDTDKLYQKWYSQHTLRASKREGAKYAALYFAYKQNNQEKTPEEVMALLGTKNSESLKGLKEANMILPKNSPDRNLDISPETYITIYMNKLKAKPKQTKRVISLYKHSLNRSSELASARPKSYAAAVIFHWLTEQNHGITIAEFAEVTDLATTTIKNRAEQVSRVLKYKKRN